MGAGFGPFCWASSRIANVWHAYCKRMASVWQWRGFCIGARGVMLG
jgi:hypothetical protein